MKTPPLLLFILSLSACGDGGPGDPDAAAWRAGLGQPVAVSDFGPNPGHLRMYLYAPEGAPSGADLVVAMHGCSQQAADYFKAGWLELADLWKFYVIFPEQPSSNNPINCFNWAGEYGDETNLIRGQGENQSIKSMIDHARARHSIGPRVFVAGFSAGAAEAVLMAATWPDVFSGAAINAGIPYRCATTVNGAFSCMSQGRTLPAREWGDLVRNAYPGYRGPYPKLSIWHGTQDSLARFSNMGELVKQWTDVHRIDQAPHVTAEADGYPYAAHKRDGVTVVETYTLTGKDHITAIYPGFAPANGCGRTAPFIVDARICAAYHQGLFFGLDQRDREAPTVTIAAPAEGATVSGNVSVSVQLQDNERVGRVDLLVDGTVRTSRTDPPAALSLAWDSSRELNGRRVVEVAAYDGAGNRGAARVSVIVTGGLPDTTPPVVRATPPGSRFSGTLAVTLSADEEAVIRYSLDGSEPTEASTRYTAPITLTGTATLRFYGRDTAGNRSAVAAETYTRIAWIEAADGTCTEHYVAGRLGPGRDPAPYLACGARHGWVQRFRMYRFGDSCWSESQEGAGCP